DQEHRALPGARAPGPRVTVRPLPTTVSSLTVAGAGRRGTERPREGSTLPGSSRAERAGRRSLPEQVLDHRRPEERRRDPDPDQEDDQPARQARVTVAQGGMQDGPAG